MTNASRVTPGYTRSFRSELTRFFGEKLPVKSDAITAAQPIMGNGNI